MIDVCAGSRRSGGDGNMLVMAPDNVVIDCICLVSALNTLSHTTNTVFTLHNAQYLFPLPITDYSH